MAAVDTAADSSACMETVCDNTVSRAAVEWSMKRSHSTEFPVAKPTVTKHFILSKTPTVNMSVGLNGVNPEVRLIQEENQTDFGLNLQELEKLAEWDFRVNTTTDLGYDVWSDGICVCEVFRQSVCIVLQRRLIVERQSANEREARQCILKQFELAGHAATELRMNIQAALSAAKTLVANKQAFAHMYEIIVQKIISLHRAMYRAQPIESVFEELYRVMRVYTRPSLFVRQFLALNLSTDLAIRDVYDICAAQIMHLRELASFAETDTDMMTDASEGI